MPWSPEPSTLEPDVQPPSMRYLHLPFYEGVLGIAELHRRAELKKAELHRRAELKKAELHRRAELKIAELHRRAELKKAPEAMLASWADQPRLDEPRSGRIEGAEAFIRWAAGTREWLLGADAAVRPVYLIVTPTRTVEEVAIDLTIDGERRELPVAIVADRNSRGLTAIRVYHSLWPLIRGHAVRSPLLRPDPDLTAPDVVGDYQAALAAGDLEGILATYQDDAVVREPAGGPYVYA